VDGLSRLIPFVLAVVGVLFFPRATVAAQKDAAVTKAAKPRARGGTKPRGAPSPAPAPAAPAAPPAPTAADNSGGIDHTPAAEQAVLTPLPIYVELPAGLSASRVFAMYKAFGATDWQKVELKKLGNGYGGEIPCQAVGSTTGDLVYYVQANDGEDIVATSGSRKSPHRVPIQNEIAGEAPHLPGKPAPARCRDKADCPPGFPGCTAGSSASAKSCETTADCGSGEKCNAEKVCESASSGKKRFWVGVHVQQDLSLVPAQQNVCGNTSTVTPPNFTCFAEDGLPYEGIPEATDPGVGTGNEVKGGLRRSTTRLLVELSYLVANNFTIGTRVGYVLNTEPDRSTAKFHVEGRIAYWFGSDPFGKQGIRPYLAVVGGVAEVDDKFSVQIYETLCKTPPECATTANRAKGLAPNPTLTVWRRGAKNFAGGSIGVMIPTSQNQGLLAEVKAQTFFPTAGFTISPSVGYALGF
jgi:hypothetical protein